MSRLPIDTAPKDGTRITVYWTDRDGQENESIAQYRSMWDSGDAGWWVALDGDTLKRVQPSAWAKPGGDADDE